MAKYDYIGPDPAGRAGQEAKKASGATMLKRLVKFVLFLLVLAVLALIGYAYLGDLSPNQSEIQEPLTIEVN